MTYSQPVGRHVSENWKLREARLALVKREAKHGKAIGRLLFEGARCFHPYLRLMTGFKLER